MLDRNSDSSPMGITAAGQAADRLFGFFPQSGASDPRIFMTGVVELLSKYPAWIAERLLSPVNGLPAKHTFLPSIKEIRDFCEAEFRVTRYAMEWDEAAREQHKLIAGAVAQRPTLEELQAKYGPNWGFRQAEGEEQRKDVRLAAQRKANIAAFEAECIAAGWSADSPISPSLAKIIREKN